MSCCKYFTSIKRLKLTKLVIPTECLFAKINITITYAEWPKIKSYVDRTNKPLTRDCPDKRIATDAESKYYFLYWVNTVTPIGCKPLSHQMVIIRQVHFVNGVLIWSLKLRVVQLCHFWIIDGKSRIRHRMTSAFEWRHLLSILGRSRNSISESFWVGSDLFRH